jgi:arsenical pump membrane protein
MNITNLLIWLISFLAVAGVIIRPVKLPEAVWAVAGAVLLVLFRLILPGEAWSGILKGTDVYLFLIGMMLLAETAREEGLFDWLAAYATEMAKGSSGRLFLLIYIVGVIVTAFLSNDATAVVLTPAVAAAVKAAKVEKPLPYLLICAFIANAASFILPISNPANLVIYGSHMPPLMQWLSQYFLASVVAISATYFALRFTQRKELNQQIESEIAIPTLSPGGKTALAGIIITAVILLVSSALDLQLGLPTLLTGVLTSVVVIIRAKKNPTQIIRGVSWAVLPLVAGLFVIVEALNKTGMVEMLTGMLQKSTAHSISATAWGGGMIIAFACNLVNNLPAGLITGTIVQAGKSPELVKSAFLIGIDLGPNLSVTGSLATILWLTALRREGVTISAWTFLKAGAIIMTTALILTLGTIWLINL